MRTRYRIHETHVAHFVTGTIVAWLPVFTTAARCDILVESLAYCREQKGLRIHAWVILDNHFHAILAAPDLSRTIADMKRHTAQRLMEMLKQQGCDWLINQFHYFCAAHKATSDRQVWQEGVHPQAMVTDEIMLQKIDYIHNNPVKRGLVNLPEHWRYSSAHEHMEGAVPLLRCDPWK
jgi:REP element-mobilizing transposase RayT